MAIEANRISHYITPPHTITAGIYVSNIIIVDFLSPFFAAAIFFFAIITLSLPPLSRFAFFFRFSLIIWLFRLRYAMRDGMPCADVCRYAAARCWGHAARVMRSARWCAERAARKDARYASAMRDARDDERAI